MELFENDVEVKPVPAVHVEKRELTEAELTQIAGGFGTAFKGQGDTQNF